MKFRENLHVSFVVQKVIGQKAGRRDLSIYFNIYKIPFVSNTSAFAPVAQLR